MATAEATLIASINAAAAKLDQLGTSAVDAALNRLRDSPHAAAARLGSAGDAVAFIFGQALRIEDAMSCAEPPSATRSPNPSPLSWR